MKAHASRFTPLIALFALSSGCPSSTDPQDESPGAPAGAEEIADPAADDEQAVAEFERTCQEHFSAGREMYEALVSDDAEERTAENTLEPYNEMSMHLRNAQGIASLMRNVHPSAAVREAAAACEREVRGFLSELSLDRDLFAAIEALDGEGLDDDSQRLIEHTLREFRRAGVDRDEETRTRLREIDDRLVELGQAFSQNIADDVRSIEVDDPSDLAGLPADYIEARMPEDDGEPIRITTEYPDYHPFMTYAESTELRRELYIENRSRAGAENEEILGEILELRAEKADLLGYDHWADYATEELMIGSGADAASFIDDVVDIARPRAAADHEMLLERKREDDPDAEVVHDYEKGFYENLIRQEELDFDAQEARAYFPYEQVEEGLLDATERVFAVEYEPVTDVDVWHETVSVYDVVREGEVLGRIYLDMHPREGKFSHAAQFTPQPGVAGHQRPEGVLVCNFPNPARGDALMEHGDVVTMFHEFGHLLHTILGGQNRWVHQSGIATEWDFVEAPSQMFEEWAWRHESLERFAHHVDTGEPISEDLAERMRDADEFGKGLWVAQQMFYAALSLGLHKAEPEELDMLAMLKELQAEYTPFPYVEGTRFYSSFGHLGGYSSNYYTYMWSLVIAKDLFTPFAEHGIWDEDTARRYRQQVLEPGGTRDAAELVSSFLGREFSFDAFEAYMRR